MAGDMAKINKKYLFHITRKIVICIRMKHQILKQASYVHHITILTQNNEEIHI